MNKLDLLKKYDWGLFKFTEHEETPWHITVNNGPVTDELVLYFKYIIAYSNSPTLKIDSYYGDMVNICADERQLHNKNWFILWSELGSSYYKLLGDLNINANFEKFGLEHFKYKITENPKMIEIVSPKQLDLDVVKIESYIKRLLSLSPYYNSLLHKVIADKIFLFARPHAHTLINNDNAHGFWKLFWKILLEEPKKLAANLAELDKILLEDPPELIETRRTVYIIKTMEAAKKLGELAAFRTARLGQVCIDQIDYWQVYNSEDKCELFSLLYAEQTDLVKYTFNQSFIKTSKSIFLKQLITQACKYAAQYGARASSKDSPASIPQEIQKYLRTPLDDKEIEKVKGAYNKAFYQAYDACYEACYEAKRSAKRAKRARRAISEKNGPNSANKYLLRVIAQVEERADVNSKRSPNCKDPNINFWDRLKSKEEIVKNLTMKQAALVQKAYNQRYADRIRERNPQQAPLQVGEAIAKPAISLFAEDNLTNSSAPASSTILTDVATQAGRSSPSIPLSYFFVEYDIKSGEPEGVVESEETEKLLEEFLIQP